MKVRILDPSSVFYGHVFDTVAFDANEAVTYVKTFERSRDGIYEENPKAATVLTPMETRFLEVIR